MTCERGRMRLVYRWETTVVVQGYVTIAETAHPLHLTIRRDPDNGGTRSTRRADPLCEYVCAVRGRILC